MSFHLPYVLATPTAKELSGKVKRLIVPLRKKYDFIRKAAGCSALCRKMRDKDNVDKGYAHHPLRFFFNTIYQTATFRPTQSTEWVQVNAHTEEELQLHLRRTVSRLISPHLGSCTGSLHISWTVSEVIAADREVEQSRLWDFHCMESSQAGQPQSTRDSRHRKWRTDLQFCL